MFLDINFSDDRKDIAVAISESNGELISKDFLLKDFKANGIDFNSIEVSKKDTESEKTMNFLKKAVDYNDCFAISDFFNRKTNFKFEDNVARFICDAHKFFGEKKITLLPKKDPCCQFSFHFDTVNLVFFKKIKNLSEIYSKVKSYFSTSLDCFSVILENKISIIIDNYDNIERAVNELISSFKIINLIDMDEIGYYHRFIQLLILSDVCAMEVCHLESLINEINFEISEENLNLFHRVIDILNKINIHMDVDSLAKKDKLDFRNILYGKHGFESAPIAVTQSLSKVFNCFPSDIKSSFNKDNSKKPN